MAEHTMGPTSGMRPFLRRESPKDGIGITITAGLIVVAALVGGVGWWAGTSLIAGAVVASGTVVVESNVKKIQQQIGGTVRAILVNNGDHVQAGDTLVRLDDRIALANLEIVNQQLDRTRLRVARLMAESTGAADLVLPQQLAKRITEPQIAPLFGAERALLASNLKLLASKDAQLKTRNQQYQDQIDGLKAQRTAAHEALQLSQRDLATVQALYDRQLASLDRLTSLKMQTIQQKGEIGRLSAAMAESEGRISENTMIGLQMEEDFRKIAKTELSESEAKEAELVERQRVAESQFDDTTIRAPLGGIVQELKVHTVGGVVAPGETMMTIVPDSDRLVIDARLAPKHIDEVHAGQSVFVRFSAFNVTSTPECKGIVRHVSADLIHDTATRIAFYSARIEVEDADRCLGRGKVLMPGMPTELYIQTGERTVWSYIFKPITDQFERALRE